MGSRPTSEAKLHDGRAVLLPLVGVVRTALHAPAPRRADCTSVSRPLLEGGAVRRARDVLRTLIEGASRAPPAAGARRAASCASARSRNWREVERTLRTRAPTDRPGGADARPASHRLRRRESSGHIGRVRPSGRTRRRSRWRRPRSGASGDREGVLLRREQVATPVWRRAARTTPGTAHSSAEGCRSRSRSCRRTGAAPAPAWSARRHADVDAHQRNAGLADEVHERAVDRLRDAAAAGRGEVLGRSVRIRVLAEVRVHALRKALGPDVALDHPQHRRGLLIGDAVERAGRSRPAFPAGRADRTRGGEPESADRAKVVVWTSSAPALHSGFQASTALGRHPRRRSPRSARCRPTTSW